MIKECKVLIWNELVMVISFNDEEVQMPSIKPKSNFVYVKFESDKYKISNKNEYDNSLVTHKKKEYKRNENDDK